MNEERRRALGIPIHKQEIDHHYVDGFCTCGERQKPEQRQHFLPSQGRVAGHANLDVIEGNWGEYQ